MPTDNFHRARRVTWTLLLAVILFEAKLSLGTSMQPVTLCQALLAAADSDRHVAVAEAYENLLRNESGLVSDAELSQLRTSRSWFMLPEDSKSVRTALDDAFRTLAELTALLEVDMQALSGELDSRIARILEERGTGTREAKEARERVAFVGSPLLSTLPAKALGAVKLSPDGSSVLVQNSGGVSSPMSLYDAKTALVRATLGKGADFSADGQLFAWFDRARSKIVVQRTSNLEVQNEFDTAVSSNTGVSLQFKKGGNWLLAETRTEHGTRDEIFLRFLDLSDPEDNSRRFGPLSGLQVKILGFTPGEPPGALCLRKTRMPMGPFFSLHEYGEGRDSQAHRTLRDQEGRAIDLAQFQVVDEHILVERATAGPRISLVDLGTLTAELLLNAPVEQSLSQVLPRGEELPWVVLTDLQGTHNAFLWNLAVDRERPVQVLDGYPISSVRLSPSAEVAAVVDNSGKLHIVEVGTGEDLYVDPRAHFHMNGAQQFSADGRRLLVRSQKNDLEVWDIGRMID